MSSHHGVLDTLDPGSASSNTSRRSTSTVRPRNPRLISLDDAPDGDYGRPMLSSGLSTTTLARESSTIRSRGATPSPHTSRGASPLPMRHPSRATESLNRDNLNGYGVSLGGLSQTTGKGQTTVADSSRAAVDFLDASWTSLQSLASSFLGSDIARPAPNGIVRTHVRKHSRPDPYMREVSKTSTLSSWGPSSTTEIGAGTQEERQALVQAKKREALLLADTGPISNRDIRHKRRDSSDQNGHLAIDPEQDEDALAYIHHVQPNDSITGVAIRYGCHPAIFRKANGFWPSDSIQSRKTVLLPVAACTVKGRPIPVFPQVDLLGSNNAHHNSLEDLSGSSIAPTLDSDAHTSSNEETSAEPMPEVEGDRIWQHESWVQIDGFPARVEIGRVPRKALGFFPRTRRKSVSYTDSEPRSPISGHERTATLSSTLSSPTNSPPIRHAVAPDCPDVGPPRSRTISSFKPRPHHQRQRSNIQFVGTGVGTLDRSAMAPGPALDGLSKFVAQHLPNLAPPPAPQGLRRTPSEYASATVPGPSTSLENIGGAVEGWVRKMTTRAKVGLSELQQGAQTYQSNSWGVGTPRRGMGDLIELNDGLESRNSPNIPSVNQRKPDLSRSVSSLHDTSSLRGRFRSPSSSGTSRTRTGETGTGYGDRVKDD
ncbi:putative LysM domain protein [Aspergillus clavatus NRRL 1]|uniref:LysM domain protein, putative n=1 Tax=Aspergillus clavatus (strain ATCC 1007 / CBS 513.65 / DSM 816 / NCTC 3887 / NRRL 1 / QM 1276 / 107) TaxID=344612 RepID=A1C972_ASPCL|nr:LysM domain protein, putative [Aspergillus clavatus NRRL 1]EAW13396.1 LysM domain protein, putative [Aspergillus clavatus NRRL 1]